MNSFDRRIARIRERIGPGIPPVVLIWQNGRQSSMAFLEAVETISNTPGIVAAEAEDPTAQSLLTAMLPSGQDLSGLELPHNE